jgi:antitoxin ParD1/3/4
MSAASRKTVNLTPEQFDLVRASIEAGEFASPSEAIGDAIRVWKQARADRAQRLEEIRARIRRSLADSGPDLSSSEMDAFLEGLYAAAERDESDAAA